MSLPPGPYSTAILLRIPVDQKIPVGFGPVWDRGLFFNMAVSYIISILIKVTFRVWIVNFLLRILSRPENISRTDVRRFQGCGRRGPGGSLTFCRTRREMEGAGGRSVRVFWPALQQLSVNSVQDLTNMLRAAAAGKSWGVKAAFQKTDSFSLWVRVFH